MVNLHPESIRIDFKGMLEKALIKPKKYWFGHEDVEYLPGKYRVFFIGDLLAIILSAGENSEIHYLYHNGSIGLSFFDRMGFVKYELVEPDSDFYTQRVDEFRNLLRAVTADIQSTGYQNLYGINNYLPQWSPRSSLPFLSSDLPPAQVA